MLEDAVNFHVKTLQANLKVEGILKVKEIERLNLPWVKKY